MTVLGPVFGWIFGHGAVYRPARVASSPRNAPETAPETDLYPFHLVNLSSSLCLFANVDWHCRSRFLLSRTSSMIPASQAPMHALPRAPRSRFTRLRELAVAPCSLARWPSWRAAPASPVPGRVQQESCARHAGTAGAIERDRHRRGQGRADPAAVGRRQRRDRGAVDEERRRNGAGRIQQSQHPASGEGRRRHLRRCPAGGPAGARRGRRDHHRAVVRPFGRRRRRGRPPARCAGDRVLDRRHGRDARRLSSELPAGVRCRSHRRLRHGQRQAVVRRHAVGRRLRQRGRRRVQAGGGAQGRTDRRP